MATRPLWSGTSAADHLPPAPMAQNDTDRPAPSSGHGRTGSSGQLPCRFDARLQLIAGRCGHRRSTAEPAQLVVDPAVRLAGAVVRQRDLLVELAAQFVQPPVLRNRLGRAGTARRSPSELLFLAAPQEV